MTRAIQVYGVDSSFGGGTALIIALVAALVMAALWAILAGSRLAGGSGAERIDRVPQLYGYTVCLIALIWSLGSVAKIADSAVSLSAPELRPSMEFGFEVSVSSFETFRTSYEASRRMADPQATPLDSIPERELRKRYEVLRADKIRRGVFAARKAIITNTLSLLLALVLFALHWRWLRRQQPVAEPGRG